MSPTSYGGTGVISIHALLAESDHRRALARRLFYKFLSTLSLRRATFPVSAHRFDGGFLSTLSLRRATSALYWFSIADRYFYPRSPCGERPEKMKVGGIDVSISIHALLAESDYSTMTCSGTVTRFLSTLSLRRATKERMLTDEVNSFLSTLSLRRATAPVDRMPSSSEFLSTLSLRRATFACWYIKEMTANISIHALLAESDPRSWPLPPKTRYFYPRSPCGERRWHPFCAPP